MQDKESDGSKLVKIVDRALERWFLPPYTKLVREEVLTAIKEAGMVIVPREPTWAMHVASLDEVGRAIEGLTWDSGRLYRAMITAGEE